MKSELFLKLLICTLILSVLSSCQREDELSVDTEVVIDPESELVDGQISGKVIDINNLPLEGVLITFDDVQTMTDIDGNFFIDAGVHEFSSAISAKKTDFFEGYKTFNASPGEITQTNITLVPKENVEIFSTSSSFRYAIDQAYIDFPSGVYTDNNNNPLTDEAIVSAYWITPHRDNLNKLPGNMNGVDETGTLVNLANYSVMLIEMKDSQEVEYDLPEGSAAEVSFPIDPNYIGMAPSEISMWYFDEDNSAWVEEGTARLVNDSYVGDISRLTYWTCGTSHRNVLLSGAIDSEVDLSNTDIIISAESIAYKSIVSLSESGNYAIRIPADKQCVMRVSSMQCEVDLYNELIGSFSSNSSLTTTIDNQLGEKEVVGTVLDCDGNIVQNGYVRYAYNNHNQLIPLVDGEFTIMENTCDNRNIELLAINTDDSTISNVISTTLSDLTNEAIMSCSAFEVSSDISYTNFDLNNHISTTRHDWQISNITGTQDRIIISPEIIDNISGDIIIKATFVANKDDDKARYEVQFLRDGFSISGNCDMVTDSSHPGDLISYRFMRMTTDINIDDHNIYPANGVGEINFDLTYFD